MGNLLPTRKVFIKRPDLFLQQCNNLLLIFATYASDKWKPSGNYGFHKYKEFVKNILSNSLFHWQLKQSVSI